MRVLRNKPYMCYVAMKLPLTLFAMMPSTMFNFYVRHTLRLEDYGTTYATIFLYAILGSVIAVPSLTPLTKRLGKAKALTCTLWTASIIYFVCSFIPFSWSRDNLGAVYIMAFVTGGGAVLASSVPDAMLADMIDYDEMLTGERNEGIYTLFEANVQQFVELAGGVFPLLILDSMGYEALADCECGCGVSCDHKMGLKYARWHCPASVGYVCHTPHDKVDTKLLFAPEPVHAPCTDQPWNVQWAIQVIMLMLPAVMGLLAASFASLLSSQKGLLISREVHREIVSQIATHRGGVTSGEQFTNPLNGQLYELPANTEESLLLEHFQPWELRMLQKSGQPRFVQYLTARLLAWGGSVAGLIVIMAYPWDTGHDVVISVCCLPVSALILLLPWDWARLKAAKRAPSVLSTGALDKKVSSSADMAVALSAS